MATSGHIFVSAQVVRRALWLIAPLFLGGCQILPKTLTESSKSDWEHSNLYNSASPYAKLFVEIDTVEGEGPSRAELRDLHEFLTRHCDKPDGITIKVDSVIPGSAAVGRTAESLAMEYINRPPDDESAFLYILFYNTRLKTKDGMTDRPSFSPFPHPIIYVDRACHLLGNPYRSTFSRAVLRHEAGHALGLCATTNHHGTEGHCTNSTCLMSGLRFSISRFFTLRNPWITTSLCQDCLDELARNKAAAANPQSDFWQGWFRQAKEGYQVLGLPGMFYVHFGDALQESNEALVAARRQVVADMARGAYSVWGTAESFNPWEHLDAFGRFSREKNEMLRQLAANIFNNIAEHLEEMAATDSDAALGALTDELIETANEFPEQRARLAWLREDLTAPPGYGAHFVTARPPEPASN